MDPSILKLLEEDEDETMYSDADVDALTAALNRDIEENISTPQPSALLSQGSNYSSNHSVSHCHNSRQDENTNRQIQQDMNGNQTQEPHKSSMVGNNSLQNPEIEVQRERNQQAMPPQLPENLQRMNNQETMPPEHPVSLKETSNQHIVQPQHPASLKTSSQQAIPPQHPANFKSSNNQQTNPTQNPATAAKNEKQVSFGQLLPLILPQLEKDKRHLLQTQYIKLRKNEVPREGFLRLMKDIAGHQMIKMALHKLQNQGQYQQAGGSNKPPQSSLQPHQKGVMPHADLARQQQLSSPQGKVDSSNTMAKSNGKERDSQMKVPPIQGPNKQQQQNFHFSQQGGLPNFENNNHPPASSDINNSAPTSAQRSLGPGHRVNDGSLLKKSTQSTNALMEAKRNNLNSSSVTYAENEALVSGAAKDKPPSVRFSSSMSTISSNPVPRSITAQLNMQKHGIPSAGLGNDAKTPPKKPSVGQKKPLDSVVSSPPQPSKKQKVSGALVDQSIEQLNDVTAVSGVNLREEEEQLFSGSKEDSLVSEASQKVVKEEEERLILEKAPLQAKLAGILSKCGVKNMDGEVERCLSLSVEERMRGLISSLIRMSKQRVDIEKSRHQTVVTSDLQKQIMLTNQKAREELNKKQAKSEKLKPNESEGSDGVDRDNEKEDGHAKSLKHIVVSKEEDEKLRTKAANVAARAAVGGDDMLSKWQQMAEQARQEREVRSDVTFGSQQRKENRPSKASNDNQGTRRSALKDAPGIGTSTKSERSQIMPQNKVARSISVKDVIAVLEREPQMSKSELLYCLYEKSSSNVD